MSDITTAELVRHIIHVVRETKMRSWFRNDFMWTVVKRLERQEQRIAELEAENREIRQTHVSHDALQSFIDDNKRLEREIAAAKEDLHCFDACQICVGNISHIDGCECDCLTCTLDCRCKDCRGENKWEWRGAKIVR